MKALHEKWVARDWGESWSASRVGTRFEDFNKTPPSQRMLRWYEDMHRGQCSIITQMHTGHVGLNVYLTRFGVVDSDLCQTCCEPETVNHFLLMCHRFMQQRDILWRALLEDGWQQLAKKYLLGKSKNKSVLLVYVAATGRFPRYIPVPS
jgi:hypothetical protein